VETWKEEGPPWQRTRFFQTIPASPPHLFTFVPWRDPPINEDLSAYKKTIAEYEAAHIWELAKKMANPYELIHTQDDSHFHPSLCIYRPLSRSYFKMIEMLGVLKFYEIIPKTQNKIRSAHVAEGPGGFIEALLETAEHQKKQVQIALAMTLKPTNNSVPGWRRASVFLQRHPEIKLHYGADNTGDIYVKENQTSFIEKAKPGVQLFTADGGFDFSIDYSVQEKRVFQLLLCSSLIGLQCLSTNGCFVLKFFDILSEHTQILIVLLGRCFREWNLYKPATSRPCNSERYFLGKGFRGLRPEILELLLKMEEQSLKGFYPVSEDFITPAENEYIIKHIEGLAITQKESLKKAIAYIHTPSLWEASVRQYFTASHAWCVRFHVPVLQKVVNLTAVAAVVSQMSARAAALQLPKPDAETDLPLPSCPALPA
jgi:cap2 methyltransferase